MNTPMTAGQHNHSCNHGVGWRFIGWFKDRLQSVLFDYQTEKL